MLFVEKSWPWHITFWFVYFIIEIPSYFFVKQPMDVGILYIVQDILLLFQTYIIIFIFFPQLYDKKKYILFIIFFTANALIFNLICSVITNGLINDYIAKMSNLPKVTLLESFFQSVTFYLLFSLFIVMSKLVKRLLIKQYYDNEKQKLQLQSELNNLKAQLSPHFLFNTMNNFYGLAVKKSNALPNLMLQLSDLMRYSLYETKNEIVSLENEVGYLLNYIELEKIRLEDTLQLEFNFDKEKIRMFDITPLILIVFVENAFKHSKNTNNQSIKIEINLNIDSNNYLFFTVENNFSENNLKDIKFTNESGIGIENVKKRLSILYPNDFHILKISNDNGIFKVALKIKLNQKKF